jgi:hypothetical protein
MEMDWESPYIDKKHGNLALYRCARGTGDVEGGVHHSGRHHLPISGASPRHASARVRDFVLMHNLMVHKSPLPTRAFNLIILIIGWYI